MSTQELGHGMESATSSALAGIFDEVLVVTDGSDASDAAVETALHLGAAHDATVHALYVVDTVEHWDMVVERREAEGEDAVEAAAERGAELGVDVEKRLRYGHGHEQVLDYADAYDVDLIVLGSARRTGVERLMRPETLPTRVQRRADAPVLAVGPEDVDAGEIETVETRDRH